MLSVVVVAATSSPPLMVYVMSRTTPMGEGKLLEYGLHTSGLLVQRRFKKYSDNSPPLCGLYRVTSRTC